MDWYENSKVIEPLKRAFSNLEGILEYPDEIDTPEEALDDLQPIIDTLQEVKQELRRMRIGAPNG